MQVEVCRGSGNFSKLPVALGFVTEIENRGLASPHVQLNCADAAMLTPDYESGYKPESQFMYQISSL